MRCRRRICVAGWARPARSSGTTRTWSISKGRLERLKWTDRGFEQGKGGSPRMLNHRADRAAGTHQPAPFFHFQNPNHLRAEPSMEGGNPRRFPSTTPPPHPPNPKSAHVRQPSQLGLLPLPHLAPAGPVVRQRDTGLPPLREAVLFPWRPGRGFSGPPAR